WMWTGKPFKSTQPKSKPRSRLAPRQFCQYISADCLLTCRELWKLRKNTSLSEGRTPVKLGQRQSTTNRYAHAGMEDVLASKTPKTSLLEREVLLLAIMMHLSIVASLTITMAMPMDLW